MKISKEEVRYIAKLAKLSFTEEETEKFVMEFDDILTHFENIDKENIDVIGSNTFDKGESILRMDEVKVFENKKELFSNAKSIRGTSIEIPKVIE
ncbi:Asp-tRNA(Asn)/Glu-tRNA(Gln) amidotransferase subunit GatC [Wukongibacter sp. M2B1]|uniref:Asp-tRNA(Asn)/Glu-tRNA(Gln) amidotransferase subunit GatC n=1 Tax=Wukongibacter sp. M2B1 TaxID=3088895 RepID=UPI003D79E4EF